MATVTIARPDPTEYAPYFGAYIAQVPQGDVLDLLARQIDHTRALLSDIRESDANFRYAERKWSIKEVIGHLADTERIFVYRALCFARQEPAPLPGFDENEYVRCANFGSRSLADLLAELRTVRAATISFFSSLDAEELGRRGVANQREYTVRSIAYIIAGHERHHGSILRDRYLADLRAR